MTDKHSVVLEFGQRYTKCGFVHELAPRAIIRTCVTHRGKEVDLLDLTGDQLDQGFKSLIQSIYFQYLGVNYKERKVILIETLFTQTNVRRSLLKVLYHHFEVPSMLVVPHHLMALVPSMISTGIVLDLGWKEAIAVPIIEGITHTSSVKTASLGSKAVNDRINRELIERGASIKINGNEKVYSESDQLEQSILENIKVKTCFVAPFERGQSMLEYKAGLKKGEPPGQPKDVSLHVDRDKTLVIPGGLRESACEILFELYGEEQTVATLILEAILDCPIDFRKTLASNIIITGGISMLPGFKHRLKEELLFLVKKIDKYSKICIDKFLFHPPLCKENYIAWLGAAIFGSTDVVTTRAVSRDIYIRTRGHFTDWSEWWPQIQS